MGKPDVKDRARDVVADLFGSRGSAATLGGNVGIGGELQRAIGGVTGSSSGIQAGFGGLGLKGTGSGGGGKGDLAVIGGIGTKGRGSGDSEYGTNSGKLGGKRSTEVSITSSNPIVQGSLDPELIRAVIRSHHGQVKYCYESQLNTNPNLAGTIRDQVRHLRQRRGDLVQRGVLDHAQRRGGAVPRGTRAHLAVPEAQGRRRGARGLSLHLQVGRRLRRSASVSSGPSCSPPCDESFHDHAHPPLAGPCAGAAPPVRAGAGERGHHHREKVPPPPIDEVERGFYLGVNAGAFYLLNAPGAAGTPRPSSLGQQAQVELGYDLGDRLSLGLFLTGTANKAGSDYLGYSNGAASGDFSALVPGAVARFHALGFKDAQGVERTWLYVRAGAGYAMFFPRQLLPDADILVFGGPGVEYYTRLRHFSVGIELTGTFLVNSGAMGVSVTPNLRYAF